MRAALVIIVALAIVLIAAVFITARSSQQHPLSATHFTFVGFQNATNAMFDAVFYTTNWPRESTSWMHEGVSYRTGTQWTNAGNYPQTLTLTIQNQTNIMVTFRVPGTNGPMRTVTRLTSNAPRWRGEVNDWLLRCGIRIRPFHSRVQWITNEITTAYRFGIAPE